MRLTKDGGIKILDDNSKLIPVLQDAGWVIICEEEQKPALVEKTKRTAKEDKHA